MFSDEKEVDSSGFGSLSADGRPKAPSPPPSCLSPGGTAACLPVFAQIHNSHQPWCPQTPPPSGPRPKPGEGAPQCFLGLKAQLGSPTPACALKPGVQLSPSMGASCSTLMPCLSPQHPQACLTLSQERPCSSQCCRAPWYSFERSTFSDPLV